MADRLFLVGHVWPSYVVGPCVADYLFLVGHVWPFYLFLLGQVWPIIHSWWAMCGHFIYFMGPCVALLSRGGENREIGV